MVQSGPGKDLLLSQSQRARGVSESAVQMTEIVLPEDTNPKGTIFGGRVLALIDKCAAIAARRHSCNEVLTVAMDSVVFLQGARLGDVLSLEARLNAAFGTSMEVEVTVHSEEPECGARHLTTTALVTMVAVNPDGRPKRIPPLQLSTDEERRRAQLAAERREARLAVREHGEDRSG
jgi:acyl-CoA hydrolase